MKTIYSLILIAIATVSCNSKPVDVEDQLKGSEWELISINENMVPANDASIDLIFTLTDSISRLNGYAGCNHYFGDVKITDGVLNIGPLGSTRMLCDSMASAVENQYFVALDGDKKVVLEENQLILKDQENTLIFGKRQGN